MSGVNLVRCVNCGYLAKRVGDALQETPESERPTEENQNTAGVIVCFVREFDLRKEASTFDGTENAKRIQALTKDRQCPCFTEWMEGYSPREHRDMNIADQMIKSQREYEERREQRLLEQSRNDTRFWQVAAIIGTIAAGVIGAGAQVFFDSLRKR